MWHIHQDSSCFQQSQDWTLHSSPPLVPIPIYFSTRCPRTRTVIYPVTGSTRVTTQDYSPHPVSAQMKAQWVLSSPAVCVTFSEETVALPGASSSLFGDLSPQFSLSWIRQVVKGHGQALKPAFIHSVGQQHLQDTWKMIYQLSFHSHCHCNWDHQGVDIQVIKMPKTKIFWWDFIFLASFFLNKLIWIYDQWSLST